MTGRGTPGTALGALYDDTAPGAVLDGEVAGWSELALAARDQKAGQESDVATRLNKLQNAMSERVPSQGGFVVPELLRSDMVLASLEAAIIRPRATVIPCKTLRLGIPMVDDTSHASSSVLGGVTWNWTEEGQQPQVGQIPSPGAPGFSNATSGGTVAIGTYQAEVAYVNAAGETTASPPSSTTTTTAVSTLTVTSPPASAGATGWYAYVTQAGGTTFTRQQAAGSPTAIGTNLTLTAPPTSTGASPQASNTTGAVSSPTYGRLIAEAKKLAVYLGAVPDELVADAAAFDAFLRKVVPLGLAWAEDQAFIAGSGTGQPQGILNAPCAISVTRSTAGKVLQIDIVNMVTRMLPQSMGQFIWLCSPDVIGQLLQLYLLIGTIPASTATAPSGWLQGSPKDGWTLLGRPLYPTEHVPALGTKGDLILVDPAFYVIADRKVMTVDASAVGQGYVKDETEFRFISRLDGRIWLQSPVTPQNASATVSPVVILN